MLRHACWTLVILVLVVFLASCGKDVGLGGGSRPLTGTVARPVVPGDVLVVGRALNMAFGNTVFRNGALSTTGRPACSLFVASAVGLRAGDRLRVESSRLVADDEVEARLVVVDGTGRRRNGYPPLTLGCTANFNEAITKSAMRTSLGAFLSVP